MIDRPVKPPAAIGRWFEVARHKHQDREPGEYAGAAVTGTSGIVERRYGLERLIDMRVRGLLTLAVAVSFLAGCGDQGSSGASRDDSGIAGLVHLGPQCPVQTEDDQCADKPAAGARITVTTEFPGDSSSGDNVVARTTTETDGTYRIAVAPGAYVVTADAGMSCDPAHAQVRVGAYSKVDIGCDTGIR